MLSINKLSINTVAPLNQPSPQNEFSVSIPNTASNIREVELERELQTLNCEKRNKLFREILWNIPFDAEWIKCLGYLFVGILGSFASTGIYSLIPLHNLFENPQYWYEFPLQVIFALFSNWAAMVILRCKYYMNTNYIYTYKTFFIMWIIAGSILFLVYATSYLIWTMGLKYQYPVPLNGYMTAALGMISFYLILWHRFPLKWRKNKKFKKRLISFLIAMTLNQAVVFEFVGVTKLLVLFYGDYQWIIAIFLPLIRELNIWISNIWASKASNGDMTSVKVTSYYVVSTTHALFLAYTVGGNATFATSVVIVGSDFLINIFICLWVIYKKRKHAEDVENQIEFLQQLVVGELVEFMVPIAYLVCLLSAYYGPNAHMIGNIGNSYWHFQAIEDIGYAIKSIAVLFLFDFGSTVVSALLLWLFCRINLFSAFVALQQEFGISFAVILMTNLNAVRNFF